jgi:23S rRNA pseudouridine1911/1915/1917 synthase
MGAPWVPPMGAGIAVILPEAPGVLRLHIEPAQAGRRLDQALAEILPDFSRSRLQTWIDAGRVLLDGRPCRCRDRVWGGEQVWLDPLLPPLADCRPQAIPLTIVYEDDHLIVIDKPAGLVVHPAAGNPDGTLQNALLHHAPGLDCLPRSGIVHRLDKDTTGLLVVAKTLKAHKSLVDQLQARRVHREYRALVAGSLVAGGTVDAPVGRHPTQRTRMAVVSDGRPAVTHYQVLERFPAHTLLAVRLETGRTHQIRVHMSHLRHPLVGDTLYAGRVRLPKGAPAALAAALQGFPRQALHAIRLGLDHPETGEPLCWEVPMAADLAWLLDLLRVQSGAGGSVGMD